MRRLIGLWLAVMLCAPGTGPVQAQQLRGTPGAPGAVAFPDSRHLPAPTPPFTGAISPNAIDSQPAWPPQTAAPEGAPNVLLILTDDVGFSAPSTFGGVGSPATCSATPRRSTPTAAGRAGT
jgi:hypothetical protein